MAAGNQGQERPANLAAAIAGHPATVLVGALDAFGEPWENSNKPDAASGADYNFVWRPGVEVWTAGADGAPVQASGTSLAAPMETASILVGMRGKKAVQDADAAEVKQPAPEAAAVTSTATIGGDHWLAALKLDSVPSAMFGFGLAAALFGVAVLNQERGPTVAVGLSGSRRAGRQAGQRPWEASRPRIRRP
jgi:hypothetical protein